MKKRFLQACEMGGSIYGKRNTSVKGKNRSGSDRSKGLKSGQPDFDEFYRSQVRTMYRVMRNTK